MNWYKVRSPISEMWIWRARVPGGWLVSATNQATEGGVGVAFVPNSNTEWELFDVILKTSPASNDEFRKYVIKVQRDLDSRRIDDFLLNLPKVFVGGYSKAQATRVAERLQALGAGVEVRPQG